MNGGDGSQESGVGRQASRADFDHLELLTGVVAGLVAATPNACPALSRVRDGREGQKQSKRLGINPAAPGRGADAST